MAAPLDDMANEIRIGVDIGGTFTDIVVFGPRGRLLVNKTSSTPADPGRAVIEGLTRVMAENGIDPAAVVEIVHGTTVGSNTILERTGARTGLLTTRGFRDVLEIGRIRTPTMFDLAWNKPEPLVRRRLRLEVEGRIAADGAVVRPLDGAGVAAAARVFRAAGVESIAICFINSFRNPAHERAAEEILRRELPSANITASYRVLPELKEYERTSTTVVNAYVQPMMQRYLVRLQAGLKGIGIEAPLLIVASNGGVMSAAAAASKPVFAVTSGPAAGVAGAARLGAAIGDGELIAFDMGGTTAKASLIEGGQLSLTSEYEFREGISTPSRFIKAGGYMLKTPSVDVAEVGSGAGSIAWVDKGGLLNVGPQSAGADPGPACYGQGGDRPTVTDANLLLGLLNPDQLAGGSLKLDAARARAAVERDVAQPLGLTAEEAALGIRHVVNANMARAIRAVTIERGRDPRRFTLVAFGGSGPVHAVDVARALEIGRVLVPVLPGVFTAVGMLASDVEHHFVRACLAPLGAGAIAGINEQMAALERDALATLAGEGYPAARAALGFALDLRYAGQGSELTVPVPGKAMAAEALGEIEAAFREEYTRTYGAAVDEAAEVVNVRLVARGMRAEKLRFETIGGGSRGPMSAPRRRRIYLGDDGGWVEAVVLDHALSGGDALAGPAVVESYDSTVVIPPGCTARTDAIGNIIIDVREGRPERGQPA